MAFWGVALCHGPDYNFHAKAGFYGLAAQESGYVEDIPCVTQHHSIISHPVQRSRYIPFIHLYCPYMHTYMHTLYMNIHPIYTL